MVANTIKKCVLCHSPLIREFYKYSQSLNCPVKYLNCCSCGLTTSEFKNNFELSKVYNERYFLDIDSGWKKRAELVYNYIYYLNTFIPLKKLLICDYGAGNGYLTKLLLDSRFNVIPFEPYLKSDAFIDLSYYRDYPFKVDILLMVEVFEHFIDAINEIEKILKDFQNPELIIFTTVLLDYSFGPIERWSYINPDSGHFTIWSNKSLSQLAQCLGYRYLSVTSYLHIYCKETSKKYIYLKILSLIPRMAMIVKKHLVRVIK